MKKVYVSPTMKVEESKTNVKALDASLATNIGANLIGAGAAIGAAAYAKKCPW